MTLQQNHHAEETGTAPTGEQELETLAKQPAPSLVMEFYGFLKTNKKWWLSPILIMIALISLFVILSLSPAAPFVYTLF